ncbi:hypothetical protein M0Q97_10675 [Candidatus Dojkabacteria bacterium]|jgi:hypothetical protein|nr:hypothetical protein [Candidatus Dojkabacteria bacterium]
MIITDKVEIHISQSNINHYKVFYNDIKINDMILVDVNQLTKGSHHKIKMKCDICDEEYESEYNILFKNDSLKYFICKKCKRKNTVQKKYGVDNVFQSKVVKEKSKNTIKEKYNVDNISQNNNIKEKKINTFIEKYGVNWGLSSDIIKEKSKNTIKEKYNVDNISKLQKIKDQKKITCFNNYGVSIISQHKNFKQNLNSIILKKLQKKYDNLLNIIGDNFIFYCDKCDKDFEINKKAFYTRYLLNVELCTICNPIGSNHISGLEENLYNFIKDNYNNEIIRSNKNIINPYEIDIYLPDLKIGFEFNGLFWHNENNVHKKYHLNKTELCEQQGIQLIHIYEDDWLYKNNIIKSMILNKLGKIENKFFARKCEIKEITDNKLIRSFLDENHIQGFVGSKIKIGLFNDNELVSLMTFGNHRVNMGKTITNIGEYELLRFCNKLNTNIIGGASKLFKYFIKNYNPIEITTYADRSFSQGKLYEILGFKFVGKTEPNYYYIVNGIRKYRFNFRKDILIKDGFDSNKTEHQIMLDRKIYRIYDSGSLKYKKTS